MSDSSLTPPCLPPGMIFCTVCGAQIAACAPVCIKCGAPNPVAAQPVSDKSMAVTALLCFFLGLFGVHRFYVGRIGAGLLTLAILALFFILLLVGIINNPDSNPPGRETLLFYLSIIGTNLWSIVDLVLIVIGSYRDGKGLPLKR